MQNNFIYFIPIFYLIGSIPFAFIITKFFGFGDIRKIGSGNVGATNVLRTGKKSLAAVVLSFDILKGFLPIITLSIFYDAKLQILEITFLGSFLIIGHIFPIWLKFKGGKGVATYIGYIFGINYNLGILFIICWIIVAFVKKYSSLASIASLIIIPIVSIYLSLNIIVTINLFVISFIVIIKHISNIKRLLSNKENKIIL